MNKKSHIIFTKKMNIELPVGCRRGLYLGSILPDLLVHTYLRGHTWKASGEKVLTKLKALEELGILNVWTGIRFGMLLHYLEDFFTMAHSRYFQGNLVEHIRYEVRLSRYIRALFAGNYKLYDGDPDNTQVYSMEDLHERIVSLQKDYQKEIREAEDETICFACAGQAHTLLYLHTFYINSTWIRWNSPEKSIRSWSTRSANASMWTKSMFSCQRCRLICRSYLQSRIISEDRKKRTYSIIREILA